MRNWNFFQRWGKNEELNSVNIVYLKRKNFKDNRSSSEKYKCDI